MPLRLLKLFVISAIFVAVVHAADAPRSAYADAVLADKPTAYWRLNDAQISNLAGDNLKGEIVGKVAARQPGPAADLFPDFEKGALAAAFSGGHVRVSDHSALKFHKGDAITLEAWIELRRIQDGQNMYVLAKGRTFNKGFSRYNENYGLRLRGIAGTARVSFNFRGADATNTATEDGWHRWTSDTGFNEKSGWHHIAVSYVFGEPKSIRGFIDGAELSGKWDMGGATAEAPAVDDDELWIGSAMGGGTSASFSGSIAEVAIFRSALASERIKSHYRATEDARRIAHNDGTDPNANDGTQPDSPPLTSELKPAKKAAVGQLESSLTRLPPIASALIDDASKRVVVEIIENIAGLDSEAQTNAKVTETYSEPAMGFVCMPTKYDEKAQRADRSSPFALRATAKFILAPGENKILLRAFNAARLLVDGKVLATTPALVAGANGHNPVPVDPKKLDANMRALRAGHTERLVTIEGGEHTITLEALVSGGKLRPEVGETSVSVAAPGKPFMLAAPIPTIPLTDAAWLPYASAQQAAHFADDAKRRAEADAKERKYWGMRHYLATKYTVLHPPLDTRTEIDALINARLESEKVATAPLVDDYAFIRRVSLDVIGLTPTPEQIQRFLDDKSPDRRAKLIDILLNDPGWADNWVGYWQDVLAENPGILKPQLNNTGPFRTWIYEAFLDNKPADRFATELILMEGSVYGGAPAGFATATQNDAPMAEKASVIGKAFMAAEMKCARCHDAPHHKFAQKDLFASAAMLKRAPQDVPKTSSIPLGEKELRKLEVTVTLKPGSSVPAEWPFEQLLPETGHAGEIPAGVLRKQNDSRERFAALITSPQNARFARVMVNRLWKRYMGTGLVEPVDDWETAKPSHPELLEWLARELTIHDYDLKHVARLILNSEAYQRTILPASDKNAEKSRALFASQTRRRMSAEQIADSLFNVAGKSFGSEELNFDVDSRENVDVFQNLGVPRRAWQFTSLSNERDRPALSLPVARTVIDVLVRFGWRESRQSPLSVRDDTPNVLQPAMLANGPAGNRIVRLSDDSALTQLCLQEQSAPELLKRIYLRILSRAPSDAEMAALLPLISEGFANRVKPGEYTPEAGSASVTQVSWSNHLSPEATKIKMELEKAARLGEPATKRLESNWRERMEDVIWSLVNSPEFVFVP